MLPRKKRVNKAYFKDLRGSTTHSLSFASLRILPRNGESKVSFVVSKKVAKTAVLRNTLRRKGYGLIEKVITHIKPNAVYIFYPKKEMVDLNFQDGVRELERYFAITRNN